MEPDRNPMTGSGNFSILSLSLDLHGHRPGHGRPTAGMRHRSLPPPSPRRYTALSGGAKPPGDFSPGGTGRVVGGVGITACGARTEARCSSRPWDSPPSLGACANIPFGLQPFGDDALLEADISVGLRLADDDHQGDVTGGSGGSCCTLHTQCKMCFNCSWDK